MATNSAEEPDPTMWQRHWSLNRDPFDDRRGSFVATPTHAEAVARLGHTIESAGRSARLVGPSGLGKSIVLARSLDLTRSPTRRVARATAPGDGAELFATLATGLGARVEAGASRSIAWRALVESARLCRWQGFSVVLAIDDCQTLEGGIDAPDLGRLDHLDPDPTSRLTVLRVGRPTEDPADDVEPPANEWGLAIRLVPLTRSESSSYLAAKLEAAGRSEPTFSPRALTRLHALTRGNPRGLDRLASLALMAGALGGLEIIAPEVVENVARECVALEAIPSDV